MIRRSTLYRRKQRVEKTGRWVVRETGEIVELGSVDGCDVKPGDHLILETPGGGGWVIPQ